MKNTFSLIMVILFTGVIHGQIQQVVLPVYFDSDSHTLTSAERQRILETIDSIGLKNILAVTAEGNTDSRGTDEYNLTLSENRIVAVGDVLKFRNLRIQRTQANGETQPVASNRTELGMEMNRRVDVRFFLRPNKPQKRPDSTSFPIAEEVLQKKRPCEGKDTTLRMPDGTLVTFDACEWVDRKDCLDIQLANSTDAALENNMILVDRGGNGLASCGMIRISTREGCEESDCFNSPLTVHVPVPDESCDYCQGRSNTFFMQSNGIWNSGTDRNFSRMRIKTVEKNGRLFYEYKVKCPNLWINCDCKLREPVKVRIKAPKGFRITSARISQECPRTIQFTRRSDKGRKVSFHLPCSGEEKYLEVNLSDKKGKTYIVRRTSLNDLPNRILFSKCNRKNEIERYLWGFIPLHKRNLYRMYIIPIVRIEPGKPVDFRPVARISN